ncbi:MAG: energy-coupling factor transporter transmembrane component T [Propionibacteriaceae bacterium]|nr:energy-coupling factor transporter transmembrane component T [Propionibacteriaceae bacterium]
MALNEEILTARPRSCAAATQLVVPDFRVGLLLILLMAAGTNFVTSHLGSAILVAYGVCVGLALGMGRRILPVLAWYALLHVVLWICLALPQVPLLPWLGIMVTLMVRAFPTYVMMWLVFTRIPMGQMMTSLARARVSGAFLMVLTVVYRYLPTLMSEVHTIWSLSRLRHTQPAWKRWTTHPIAQVENLIVPVLMRSGRIADELSAVAVCKGMDPAIRRTERIAPRIGAIEIALLASTIAAIVACKVWAQ